ncbi:MAG TPA: zf-HC2 domain-containing protein [Thermoanaerobaculia bacterium]|nr:zf-HC2 domain-containing protein [Thermoanaerobaculia bacterium]
MDHEKKDFCLDHNQTTRLADFLCELPEGTIGDHLTEAQLSAYAGEELPPATVEVMDQHLNSCEKCAERLEWYLSFRGAMSEEANRRRDVTSAQIGEGARNVREKLDHRTKETLISEATLDALRSGYEQAKAFDKIFDACLCWVRRKGELPHEVYMDIVSEAIFNELDTLRLPTLNAAEASKCLLLALGRLQKSAIRRRRREVELKDFNEALIDFNGVESNIEATHMREVARLLKGFISLALDSLSDRDYALLYERYNLKAYGIKPRKQKVSLQSLTPGARKTALSRARIRLLNELERRLSEASACLDEGRLVARDALRFIQSGRLSGVLETTREAT